MCLVHVYDMTHHISIIPYSYVCHDSSISVTRLAHIFGTNTRVCVHGIFFLSLDRSFCLFLSLPPSLSPSLSLSSFLSVTDPVTFFRTLSFALSYTYSLALSHFLFLLFSLSRYNSLSLSVHSIHPHIQTYTRAQAKTHEQTRAYCIIFSL